MNNQQHYWDWQTLVMIGIACVSFALTRIANVKLGLANHPDYVAFIGSFVIGILGNMYSRKWGGTAFNVMLTAVLLLVPDGLAAAGGLADNYKAGSGQDEYTQVSQLALKSKSHNCYIPFMILTTSSLYSVECHHWYLRRSISQRNDRLRVR